jgi:inhibitor of KinA sporulation pathway (predicted exonuclease)
MGKDVDRLLVVDVESTCWDGDPPQGQVSEIIEIGICVLNLKTNNFEDSESILVKPVKSKVSDFCTSLTTLTQADVDKGIDFQEACSYLIKIYKSRYKIWASWGDYDRFMFERLCSHSQYPFGSRHINLKTLFSILHGLPNELGMDAALKHLSFPLDGTHHRAGDDAKNITRIASTMIASFRNGTHPINADVHRSRSHMVKDLSKGIE